MQDESEVLRWLDEGRTYRWMADEYMHKYNLKVSPTMFSEFRATRGLERRIERDVDLIPWAVARPHRWDSILSNLRTEARIRAGAAPADLDYPARVRWEAFRRELQATDTVVYYDPETERGFFLVPRETSDGDIIRRPCGPTTGRGRRD